MLNRFVWDTYLKSGGNDVVEMFRKNLAEKYSEDYAEQIRSMVARYCPMESVLNELGERLMQLCLPESIETVAQGQNSPEQQQIDNNDTSLSGEENLEEYDIIDALMDDEYDHLYGMLQEEYQAEPKPQDVFCAFISHLVESSTLDAMDYPEYFVPYYFPFSFNVLQIIAEKFEIILPPIPLKKDYNERVYYYGDICRVLTEFRVENGLSPYELYAFLYDFAPKYIGGMKSYIIEDLPEARDACFIGASTTDPAYSEDPDTITAWQCHEDTRPGDMIVMYLRTPVSAVTSVWRACSLGFIDPFCYYYRFTYINKPVKINPVTQRMIKNDPVLGDLSIVKKNMQGINGVELLPSAYNRLMDLAGAEVYRFLQEENPRADIKREKDVEDKLIKPLIKRLGYNEEEYIQQLNMEIGNHNHTLIPDFVLLPQQAPGHYSGFAIIEAKKTIPNEKFLSATKTQARSYAKLLNTRYSIIASQEKVWVTSSKDDYDADIFIATWQELNDPDTFFKLDKLIGKH